jgi:hypothetical protein
VFGASGVNDGGHVLKKALVLLVPIAAVAVIALIPTSSASADCVYPPGTPHTNQYCMLVCHVPAVAGKRLARAKAAIVAHNCLVGKVKTIGKKHKRGFHRVARLVVSQSLKAGVYASPNTSINLKVRWKFQKNRK